MGRMSDTMIEIEELLFDGLTLAEIARRVGMSVDQVEATIERIENTYLEPEPDIDSYTEYQDLPWGGDDQFETCGFYEEY